jgi:hypothetical protein
MPLTYASGLFQTLRTVGEVRNALLVDFDVEASAANDDTHPSIFPFLVTEMGAFYHTVPIFLGSAYGTECSRSEKSGAAPSKRRVDLRLSFAREVQETVRFLVYSNFKC